MAKKKSRPATAKKSTEGESTIRVVTWIRADKKTITFDYAEIDLANARCGRTRRKSLDLPRP
jgi:hypothetical protein